MRFVLILVCAFISLSMGVSATAHAAERGACIEQAAAHAQDAADSGDQSGRSDNTAPDQHLNCHAHQYAALRADDAPPVHGQAKMLPVPATAQVLAAATTGPALRPPQT